MIPKEFMDRVMGAKVAIALHPNQWPLGLHVKRACILPIAKLNLIKDRNMRKVR